NNITENLVIARGQIWVSLNKNSITTDNNDYRQSLISSIIILSLLLPLQGGSILHLGFLQQNQVFLIVFSVIFSQ
ncbi:hypothetical protein CMK16_10855, partial [Candidatus Poribacteria bacterium]|nr:hypothetical protein [Candidatus Poribacteria bacterium]